MHTPPSSVSSLSSRWPCRSVMSPASYQKANMLDPALLQTHYKRFQVDTRIMLSGHSHQAWPDVALEATQQCWLDAASYVDSKWSLALDKAARVQRGFAACMQDNDGEYSLAPNTHQLLVHWLSGLPRRAARRLVTTDGEFHSMRRQLNRLEEDGWTIVRIPTHPETTVGSRLAAALTPDTSAVMTSAVFFLTGRMAGELDVLARAARGMDVPLLVDVYHVLGNMPFPLSDIGLHDAFIVGGGYKYLQMGEGVCFLRYPADCDWRPVYTGWFADFASLEDVSSNQVNYHSNNGQRFVGSTVDPVSWYRAAAVVDFFEQQGMTPHALRELYQHQLEVLRGAFVDQGLVHDHDKITLDLDVPLQELGAFLTLTSPHAGAIKAALLERGVLTDYRGNVLRIGPAPYVTDAQLREAMRVLKEVVDLL